MNDINMSQMTAAEVIEAVKTADSIEPLRKLAKDMNVPFSGNTGLETLRGKLMSQLDKFLMSSPASTNQFDEPDLTGFQDGSEAEEEYIQVNKSVRRQKPKIDLLTVDPSTIQDTSLRREAIRAQALRLVRVRLRNLDPNDSSVTGAIISVQNKYTGKVSKLIPFGDETENGYHIPWMLYEHLKNWKFPLRKEVKSGRFGVKAYKTVMTNKFSVEILPPLTMQEIRELGVLQRASQSIDTSN